MYSFFPGNSDLQREAEREKELLPGGSHATQVVARAYGYWYPYGILAHFNMRIFATRLLREMEPTGGNYFLTVHS